MNLTLPAGVTAKYTPAADESVDAEFTLVVNGIEAAGIQLSGRFFCANCWTGPNMEAMEHGPERRSITVATADAIVLLRKYKWIG